MRQGEVYCKEIFAGIIREEKNGYVFEYDDNYLSNEAYPPISLTLPKSNKIHSSKYLFPFFFNMLSEGYNKNVLLRSYKIDEKDYFGLLLATTSNDTIGAVTIKKYDTD